MVRNTRKMSYARLSARADAPECKAELERRRSLLGKPRRAAKPEFDYDQMVRDTVAELSNVILARIRSELTLILRGIGSRR